MGMTGQNTATIIFLLFFILLYQNCLSQDIHPAEMYTTKYITDLTSAKLMDYIFTRSAHYENSPSGWPYFESDKMNIGALEIDSTDSQDSIKNKLINKNDLNANFSASFQYQRLTNGWNVTYYGVHLEGYVNNNFSLSGQIYVGKASDKRTYIHIPSGGLILFIVAKAAIEILFDEDKPTTSEYIILILTENLHYNMYNKNNKIIISPFINIFGFDANGSGNPDKNQSLLSNGVGLNLKFLPVKHMTMSAMFTAKYFISMADSDNSKNYLGYCAGLNIGYIF